METTVTEQQLHIQPLGDVSVMQQPPDCCSIDRAPEEQGSNDAENHTGPRLIEQRFISPCNGGSMVAAPRASLMTLFIHRTTREVPIFG